MKITKFISVGENIHCTRVYKTNGKFVGQCKDGKQSLLFSDNTGKRNLAIPQVFIDGADWQNGKIKHCACAIWQGNYGETADGETAVHYLQNMAKVQEKNNATYLDINVDEFSTDTEERIKLMKWTVEVIQNAVKIPISVDSSNPDILRAGLETCDQKRGRPMLNSVSLERLSAVDLALEFKAVVIASAAGENDLPNTTEGRMANLSRIITYLTGKGLKLSDIHVDPLVFPISTDSNNGKGFLDSVAAIRAEYGPEIHIVAGLSNISFGMPQRNLITQVFTYMAVEAGADGGIVDPLHVNIEILNNMDTNSDRFKMTKALLTGEDEFGMEFITAAREGLL